MKNKSKDLKEEHLVFMSDDMYLPIHYKGMVVQQPFYSGDGNHSVKQLEAICNQYKEYCHQQAVVKQRVMERLVELKFGLDLSNDNLIFSIDNQEQFDLLNETAIVVDENTKTEKPKEPNFNHKTVAHVYKYLNVLERRIGEILTEYDWREICTLKLSLEEDFATTKTNFTFYYSNEQGQVMVGDLVEVVSNCIFFQTGERFVVNEIERAFDGSCLLNRTFSPLNKVKLIKRKGQ